MREYDKRCWSTGWNIEENSACVNLWTNYTVLCVKRWSIKTQCWCLWIATCIFVYKCINYRTGILSQRGLLAIKPVTNTSINNYKIEKSDQDNNVDCITLNRYISSQPVCVQ